MHRTQIYLQDALYEKLRLRSRSLGVSLPELIRGALEKEIEKDPTADARAFFDRLGPLDSFAGIEPETYVRELRDSSRLLRAATARKHDCPLWTGNRKHYPMDDIVLFDPA